MFTLVDVLLKEHQSMRELLLLMQEQLDQPGDPDYSLLAEILQYCETYPGAYHHPKEDLIYDALCTHAPDAAAALEDLGAEHMVMAGAARDVFRLVSEAAEGDKAAEEDLPRKVGAYLRFYRLHMRREELEFFPLALETLTHEHWLELESQVMNPTDPLFEQRDRARLMEMLGRPGA